MAAINPKRSDCPYPFKGLAGVGLAYKLAQALLRSHQQVPIRSGKSPGVELDEADLLDLVALGTVADLAPLLDENRSLVQRGLMRLNQPQRPGLQAMMALAGVAPGQVTAMTIGFVLGPRLNVAGRLDSAMVSYELLQTDDVFKASQLAQQLDQLNTRRQHLTAEAVEQAVTQIEADGSEEYVLMAGSQGFLAGIVGLVAGRLVEQYYRPVLVMELGERTSRGSARSIAEFDITSALDLCADRWTAGAARRARGRGRVHRRKHKATQVQGQATRDCCRGVVDPGLAPRSEYRCRSGTGRCRLGHLGPAQAARADRL